MAERSKRKPRNEFLEERRKGEENERTREDGADKKRRERGYRGIQWGYCLPVRHDADQGLAECQRMSGDEKGGFWNNLGS